MIRPEALAALRDYKQADEDGVMVLVSRQALDEAIAFIEGIACGCAMSGCQIRED